MIADFGDVGWRTGMRLLFVAAARALAVRMRLRAVMDGEPCLGFPRRQPQPPHSMWIPDTTLCSPPVSREERAAFQRSRPPSKLTLQTPSLTSPNFRRIFADKPQRRKDNGPLDGRCSGNRRPLSSRAVGLFLSVPSPRPLLSERSAGPYRSSIPLLAHCQFKTG